MRTSYRIFKILGISIELHITFILFLLFLLLVDREFFSLWVIVFSIVLFHELSHSIVAKYFKINVPRITLWPIGGLASIEVPEDPVKEFLISLAGPFSNFYLMGVILALYVGLGMPLESIQDYGGVAGIDLQDPASVLGGLFWINLILGAFNLLPGFPMDGGRVLRAFLAFWMDYVKATQIAVNVGRVIALLFVVLGWFVLGNVFLVVIGIFLLFTGGQELSVLRIKRALRGMTLGRIAVRDLRYVNEFESVKNFTEFVAHPGQEYYPVADYDGRVVGLLSMESLAMIDPKDYAKVTVGKLAGQNIDTIDAGTSVEESLPMLLTKDFILVVEGKKIIGYLDQQHLMEIARFYGLSRRA